VGEEKTEDDNDEIEAAKRQAWLTLMSINVSLWLNRFSFFFLSKRNLEFFAGFNHLKCKIELKRKQ